jgi:squalene cyclase
MKSARLGAHSSNSEVEKYMNAPDVDSVRSAAQKAQRVLFQAQHADGSWDWPNDLGVFVSAQALVALKFAGRLDAQDAEDGARYLASRQLPDGSFPGRPFATQGELGATASAWAAFRACGRADDDPALARARGWVEAHGGADQTIALIGQGDTSALFLAMVGLLDPHKLPAPSLFFTLLPPVEKWLERKFNTGVLMAMAQTGALVHYLRGDYGEHGDQRSFLESAECKGALSLLGLYQNPDGSWNSNTAQQVVSLPALIALGVPANDGRLTRAIDWLLAQRIRDADGLWFASFASAVWTTALAARALMRSGISRSDARLSHSIDWLVRAQVHVNQPEPSQPKPGAPRTGGYAFEGPGNVTMPDCDDTGVALGALGLSLAPTGSESLAADLAERVRLASARARDWLLGMQNEDGGWGSYQWGMPGKPRGPMLEKPLDIPMNDPIAMLKFMADPPIALGDPSAEDATARILYGLGQLGYTVSTPAIAQALEFLKEQQLDSGAFWGRWMVNYNAATSCVLLALVSLGADMKAAWVRRAIDFLVNHQNPDGGWGEGVDTYAKPALAGTGPSMPPLTGMVLTALIEAGEAESETVSRGIAYLLATQRSDGTWSNGNWLHAYVPPTTFYDLPGEPRYYTLEALGCWLAARAGIHVGRPGQGEDFFASHAGDIPLPQLPSRIEGGAWNPAFLAAMRGIGDAPADAVVRDIFENGDQTAVNRAFATLVRSDDPLPAGLPERVMEYFETTSALPSWADREQIATAQRMFTRDGWAVAAGLFCSSLPQAYAALNGARVLLGTGGMTFHTERRVFETAQFLFDVMDEGALGPTGRGVRAAQKVRLLHGTIRHLTVQTGKWDSTAWGIPINQEDLAGTLMTFSCVVLDALKALRIEFSREEGEAYVHAWNVVGHFLGIDRRLIPRDLADGEALMEQIRTSQWVASREGATLAAALVKMQQAFLPGHLFDGLPVSLMRELAGDHCADLLGLPRADWTRRLVHAATELDDVFGGDHHRVSNALLYKASHALMKGLVLAFREGKQTRFRIPSTLIHAWNLED